MESFNFLKKTSYFTYKTFDNSIYLYHSIFFLIWEKLVGMLIFKFLGKLEGRLSFYRINTSQFPGSRNFFKLKFSTSEYIKYKIKASDTLFNSIHRLPKNRKVYRKRRFIVLIQIVTRNYSNRVTMSVK